MRAPTLTIFALSLACAPAASPPSAAPATAPAEVEAARTIVFVRHAEKENDDRDAKLSETGHARARCLAQVLGDAAITHAFTTEFERTKQTLAPLVERRALAPTAIPAEGHDAWLSALRGLPAGAIAVVAGHSNTVPNLLAALGVGEITIDHGAYDWMFVVSLPDAGPPTLLRTHYCPS
jgi:phosphohistidine phosphatase SixA